MNGDIELELAAGSEPGEYSVRVVQAPAGGNASGVFRLDVDGILERRTELESTVLASAVAARRTTPVAELPVRGVGQQLFQALFTREVYGTYRASLGAAQHSGQQLRVVLRLAAPELAALPWEMLFDPETETYLCQTEPLLRHIPAPDYNLKPLEIVPPLRILGLVAAPRDLPSLDGEAEKRHLAAALDGPISEGRIELVWAPGGTWEDIQSSLLAGPWHVVHFIGHGDYDSRSDEGRIALVGADGRAAMVRAIRLMALLSVAAPRPRLVVLNSCSSGESGQKDLFSGTASTLVRSGISAVAAMQFAISDVAAIAFAQGFYAAIASGRGVDEAARIGRISVMASPDGTLEWVTPALYVRGGSTQLFTLSAPPKPPARQQAGQEPEGQQHRLDELPDRLQDDAREHARLRSRQAQLHALYVQASAELRAKHYGLVLELLDDLLTLDPDYRDAAALRLSAAQRQERAEAYERAVEAEDAEDWSTAISEFSKLQDDPAFADAPARKERAEKRQRIADLQAELDYHAGSGNWQAVLDVAAELEALDPAAADPDGLTTAARGHLGAAAEPPGRPASRTDRQSPVPPSQAISGTDRPSPVPPSPPVSRSDRPTRVPKTERSGAVPASDRPSAEPAEEPQGLDFRLLGSGGLLLAIAGGLLAVFYNYLLWYDENDWWYNRGSGTIQFMYGVLAPAGYSLLLLSGLPVRTVLGRTALGVAVGAEALMGLVGFEVEAQPAALVCSLAHAVFGAWAGILAIRGGRAMAGWVLLVSAGSLPLVWAGLEESAVIGIGFMVQGMVVAACGAVFLVLAVQMRKGRSGHDKAG
ncbi:CHAT domain-containing protein [Arthrobacter sp. BE255]|uniref:CHAT domain-containing protein n=1 Tax=Arthrobacter sp. BE255 TaxID=2817721 RepID=UPI00285F2971|nr:CHAT domain-containing protein [Arthrobacter sp. BE255]MDR7161877.1 hypothetical protein [Arthrobacter sp. BE255]